MTALFLIPQTEAIETKLCHLNDMATQEYIC
jgi:hypothetical protein